MADENSNSGMFELMNLRGEAEEPMVVTEEKSSSSHQHTKRFPEKLWEAACDETSDLISWAQDGASLYVHEDRFEDEVQIVYPGLVCVKSFTNFRRQLREYGFDWRQNHVQMLFHFSHPSFRRDAPRLAKGIVTRRRSRTKQTLASSGEKGKEKDQNNSEMMTESDGNESGQMEGAEGSSQITIPLRNFFNNQGPQLMSCTQQSQSPLTYHVMPMVQPTQAYFIPFSQNPQQELGGSGDYKTSDKDSEDSQSPGAPPSTQNSQMGVQPTAPLSMMTMVPSSGGMSYGVYFPQCSPWMQPFGGNICSFPAVQTMATQSDGSAPKLNLPLQSTSGSSNQWNGASPDQPMKKKMKLDFDWYGRITPVETTSPDRNSSSSMSTCASKGSPPDLDQ